jgi:DNA-binding SARP family transcriptional activator
VEYAVLGPLEVRDDGRTIAIGRGKPRAVLALLLLNAGRVVSAERLIDELWRDDPPATAATALQVYVSKLRKLLGDDAIRTRAPGYVVDQPPADLRAFERLTAEARDAEPAVAARLLREALGLWRGAPLSDVDLPSERVHLESLQLAAHERLIDAELARGRAADVVPELETLVAEHPLRESFRAQLMLALYQAGRQADALDAYRDARRTLVDELGIEPGERLQQLEQSILRHDASLEAARERTITATVVFLDLGLRGEVEAVAPRAIAVATEELAQRAERVEAGLADAMVGVFRRADDATRAAAAAAESLERELGRRVAPRAGLSTGEVSLGVRVGGAAVVLAARRVREAGPGEVVVGERTAAAASGHEFARRGDGYVLVRSGGS